MSSRGATLAGLIFVSLLVGFAQIHLRARSATNPTEWLDAFDRTRCGQRRTGRPWDNPNFKRHSVDTHLRSNESLNLDGQDDDDEAIDWRDERKRSNRASVGYNAWPGEVPWAAELTLFYGWLGLYYRAYCGAVLIHKNLVLTAAHCIIDSGGWHAQIIWVRSGLYNWHEYEKRQSVGYTKYCVPKEYKHDQSGGKRFDIAVVRLDQDVTYDENTQPVCLPGKVKPREREHCLAAGMGMTEESDGRVSPTLKVVPMKWCGLKRPGDENDQSCWITADRINYPGSMCLGDSGSGLYCPENPKLVKGTPFTGMGLLSSVIKGPCDKGSIRMNFYTDFSLTHDKIMELVEECSQD